MTCLPDDEECKERLAIHEKEESTKSNAPISFEPE